MLILFFVTRSLVDCRKSMIAGDTLTENNGPLISDRGLLTRILFYLECSRDQWNQSMHHSHTSHRRTLIYQQRSIGANKALSPKSRTRDIVAHAGHSRLPAHWRDKISAKPASWNRCPNRTWSTALARTEITAAMVVLWYVSLTKLYFSLISFFA